jgi:hypothetical protein
MNITTALDLALIKMSKGQTITDNSHDTACYQALCSNFNKPAAGGNHFHLQDDTILYGDKHGKQEVVAALNRKPFSGIVNS